MRTFVKVGFFLIFIQVTSFGFGQSTDLFLYFGQSNMAGRALVGSDTLEMDNVLLLDRSGTFIPAKNPLNIYSTIRKDSEEMQRLGPAFSCSERLATYLDDTIRIIVQARGGTAIEKFMKGSDWGYYEALLNRTKNALERYPDSRLRAVFFHQGEANSRNPEEYIKKLHQVLADLRADLDIPGLPVFIGEVGPWNDAYQQIRSELKRVPDVIPNTYFISAEGLTNQDNAHFDRESVLEFGKRYAEKCIEVIYK